MSVSLDLNDEQQAALREIAACLKNGSLGTVETMPFSKAWDARSDRNAEEPRRHRATAIGMEE